jgi:hypothetical protein
MNGLALLNIHRETEVSARQVLEELKERERERERERRLDLVI